MLLHFIGLACAVNLSQHRIALLYCIPSRVQPFIAAEIAWASEAFGHPTRMHLICAAVTRSPLSLSVL